MRAHPPPLSLPPSGSSARSVPRSARPGWDNRVLDEMRQNIHTRLRDYWDAGIRGPDFVWAATGPAMEAYSKHPVVKKANEPGKLMEVCEFLRAVRRLVVDFVVGRVLTGDGDETPRAGWTTSPPTTSFTATTSAWTTPRSGPASSTPSRATCQTTT